jgi:adenosylmethionine-8-amino-7-oxononanoate aminotransferase
VIYVMPPYVITMEELDWVYSVIEEGISFISSDRR